MGQDRRALLAELRETAQRGKDLLAELSQLRVEGSDGSGALVAVADGHGNILGLRMSDAALRYPQRLGVLVTSAVRRARRAAADAAQEHQAARFPGLPDVAEAQAAMSPPPERVDLQAVDYPGSTDVRQAIAEGMEARQDIERTRREVGEHRVRQEIGTNAGTVVMDGTATRVKIELHPDAVNNVGAKRLGDQIVTALRKAEARAEQDRHAAFDRINVGGRSMGNLVRDAQRVLGMDTSVEKGEPR